VKVVVAISQVSACPDLLPGSKTWIAEGSHSERGLLEGTVKGAIMILLAGGLGWGVSGGGAAGLRGKILQRKAWRGGRLCYWAKHRVPGRSMLRLKCGAQRVSLLGTPVAARGALSFSDRMGC
jgi:hypothetical protein